METLHKAQLEGRLQERLKKFTGYKLLIIDELGYLPITRDDSKLFFQLIDRRYERNSTIVTTNINFSQWDDYIWRSAYCQCYCRQTVTPCNSCNH